MAKTRAELRARAIAAVTINELIEVNRGRHQGKEPPAWGFATSVGEDWLLLHLVDPDLWMLDGHIAVRVEDIKSIDPYLYAGNEYPRLALRHFGEDQPQPIPWIDLTSTKALIKTIADNAPLIGIACEKTDPDCYWFGTPLEVKGGVLTLLDINTDGSWDEEPSKHRLSDITRIQFGSRYEEALAVIGGPPPAIG